MINNNEVTESINKDFSELFKSWFTEEELKKLENDFEAFQKRLLEQKESDNDEPMFGNH